jgi:hypothetical protein
MTTDQIKVDELIRESLKGVTEDKIVIDALVGVYLLKYSQELLGLISLMGGLSPDDFAKFMIFLDKLVQKLPEESRVSVEKMTPEMTSRIMGQVIATFASKLDSENQSKVEANLDKVVKNME